MHSTGIQPDGSGSEDSLHVHVYAPPLNASSRPLPVLVYIHGGGLTSGSANFENMSAFSLHWHADVVAVAVKCRLNIFGCLALSCSQGADGSVGDCGMRDQQLALSWVRSNILVFGGGPARVTVAGQSSGGTSTFALCSSPFSAGLFDNAISMSHWQHQHQHALSAGLYPEPSHRRFASLYRRLFFRMLTEHQLAAARSTYGSSPTAISTGPHSWYFRPRQNMPGRHVTQKALVWCVR